MPKPKGGRRRGSGGVSKRTEGGGGVTPTNASPVSVSGSDVLPLPNPSRDFVLEAGIVVSTLCFLFIELFHIYGLRFSIYPLDAVCLVICIVSTPLYQQEWMSPLASKLPMAHLLRPLAGSVVILAVGFLILRCALRYSFSVVLMLLVGSLPVWAYWAVGTFGVGEFLASSLLSRLHWVVLGTPTVRGLCFSLMVAFLPSATNQSPYAVRDVVPTRVLFFAAAGSLACLDLVSILLTRRDRDVRVDLTGMPVSPPTTPTAPDSVSDEVMDKLMCHSPFWTLVVPDTGANTPTGFSTPLASKGVPLDVRPWEASVSYPHLAVVSVPFGSSELLYRCIRPTDPGFHPRSWRSRLLQVLIADPIRAVRATTVFVCLLAGGLAEGVLLFAKWRLYLAMLCTVFGSLVVTYTHAFLLFHAARGGDASPTTPQPTPRAT